MSSRSRRADAVQRATNLGVTCHLDHGAVPLHMAIQRTADRRDPNAHRLDAEAVRSLSRLFEPPEESEGGCPGHCAERLNPLGQD